MSEYEPESQDQATSPADEWTPPRELLEIRVEARRGQVLATVSGELDESTAPGLIARLEQEAGQEVVVDLSGLTFCGSAGLSALILLDRSLRESGGSLAVVRPTIFVVELLEMAGIGGLVIDQPAVD